MTLRNAAALTFAALLSIATGSHAAEITVCFTPEYHGGPTCTEQITSAIAGAHKSILVQAYGLTSAPIAKALVEAHRRGVDVRVILDKSNVREGYSAATFLQNMGISPLIDSKHAIAHNKVMVLDDHEVITGSFNFTKAAEQRNAENVLFVNDPAIASAYSRNWRDHANHSQPMVRVGSVTPPPSAPPSAAREDNKGTTATIVGNRRSKIYEWPGCPSYDAISQQNRVEFPSRQAAEQAGFRPARNCPQQ